jgi:hypothetical protein
VAEKEQVKIAIHQPNFLPWPGYFYKMSLCDVFVFLDDVQINRRSYTQRVKIRHQSISGKDRWLSVPIKKHPEKTLINHIQIDPSKKWTENHWKILQNTYRNAPNWDIYSPWMKELFDVCFEYTSLSEMNIFLIKEIAKNLDIKCKMIKSSALPVYGKADTYTYQIVKHLDGIAYIRGKGEQRYAKDPVWQIDQSIEVVNINYDPFMKNDPSGTWQNGFSIIDLLMENPGFIPGNDSKTPDLFQGMI